MSKRAELAALKIYPPAHSNGKRFAKRVQSEIVDTHRPVRTIFQKGYEQAEKDIWAAIEKYLSKLDTGDFATVGWILKHLDEYKKAILEEE